MLSELQNKYHDITTQKVGFYIQFPSSWSIYNNSIPFLQLASLQLAFLQLASLQLAFLQLEVMGNVASFLMVNLLTQYQR